MNSSTRKILVVSALILAILSCFPAVGSWFFLPVAVILLAVVLL